MNTEGDNNLIAEQAVYEGVSENNVLGRVKGGNLQCWVVYKKGDNMCRVV